MEPFNAYRHHKITRDDFLIDVDRLELVPQLERYKDLLPLLHAYFVQSTEWIARANGKHPSNLLFSVMDAETRLAASFYQFVAEAFGHHATVICERVDNALFTLGRRSGRELWEKVFQLAEEKIDTKQLATFDPTKTPNNQTWQSPEIQDLVRTSEESICRGQLREACWTCIYRDGKANVHRVDERHIDYFEPWRSPARDAFSHYIASAVGPVREAADSGVGPICMMFPLMVPLFATNGRWKEQREIFVTVILERGKTPLVRSVFVDKKDDTNTVGHEMFNHPFIFGCVRHEMVDLLTDPQFAALLGKKAFNTVDAVKMKTRSSDDVNDAPPRKRQRRAASASSV